MPHDRTRKQQSETEQGGTPRPDESTNNPEQPQSTYEKCRDLWKRYAKGEITRQQLDEGLNIPTDTEKETIIKDMFDAKNI